MSNSVRLMSILKIERGLICFKKRNLALGEFQEVCGELRGDDVFTFKRVDTLQDDLLLLKTKEIHHE